MKINIRKDFKRAKKHQIRYKKIFNDDIDFENLEVEVSSVTRNKKAVNASIVTSEDLDIVEVDDQNKKIKTKTKKNHDALVIEYCPKVFRELRTLDEYSARDLD